MIVVQPRMSVRPFHCRLRRRERRKHTILNPIRTLTPAAFNPACEINRPETQRQGELAIEMMTLSLPPCV